jgi:hypothetical protein
MIEKLVMEETDAIVCYEFITIKPLGKSSQGTLLTQGMVFALETGEIRVMDVYGNLLLNFTLSTGAEDKITSLSTSSSQDEMLVGVMTGSQKLHVYPIDLKRRGSSAHERRGSK